MRVRVRVKALRLGIALGLGYGLRRVRVVRFESKENLGPFPSVWTCRTTSGNSCMLLFGFGLDGQG